MPKILQDPRKRILQEVETLLHQGGYSAVTIRSVAHGCGVGVGTVYNYFPSKENLMAEYLLSDWMECIAVITAVKADAAEPVARCIYDQLWSFALRHEVIFRDEAAHSYFAGSFSQYHGLLRSQLAAPLEPFTATAFAAEFMAEALLTWTMDGRPFAQIWDLIRPCTV